MHVPQVGGGRPGLFGGPNLRLHSLSQGTVLLSLFFKNASSIILKGQCYETGPVHCVLCALIFLFKN